MSFPKAKLTRFNDVNDYTPSPADYSPIEVKSRATGCVISGKERFGEEKPENVSIQSGNSSYFRTPTPLKKRKPHVLKQSKDDDVEALKEKTVECINKDAYIKELIEQIDELKSQVSHLKSQREIIAKDRDDFQLDVTKLEEIHSAAVQTLLNHYDDDKKEICGDIALLNAELFKLREEHLLLRQQYEKELQALAEKVTCFDEKYQCSRDDYLAELRNKDMDIINKENELQAAYIHLEALRCAHNFNVKNIHNVHRKDMEALQKKMKWKIMKIREKYFEKDSGQESEESSRTDPQDQNIFDDSYDEIYDVTIGFELELFYDNPQNDQDKLTKVDEAESKVTNFNSGSIEELLEESKAHFQKLKREYQQSCLKRKEDFEMRKFQEKHSQENELAIIKNENESHLLQINENSSESIALAKIQADEKHKDIEEVYKLKLEKKEQEAKAVLDECVAICDYAVRESEIEKEHIESEINKVNQEVEKRKCDEDWCKYKKLIQEYDRAMNKFETLEEKLLLNITLLNDQKKHCKNDNFAYNVAIHRTHETIEALTKRLFESDNDVEQLKTELKNCDFSRIQIEERKDKLSEELDNLNRLNEDLEIQQESSVKVFENEIKAFQDNILRTVEGYKSSISKIIENYKTKLETAEYNLQDVTKCLYEQEVVNSEAFNLVHLANIEIQDLEKTNRHLEDQICNVKIELERANAQIEDLTVAKVEIERKLWREQFLNATLQKDLEKAKVQREEAESLNKQISQLQEKGESYYRYCEYYRNKADEYEKEINDVNNINKSYIDQSKKYEDLLQKCEEMEDKNLKLQKLVDENDVLIGPFRRQLEAYEYERQTLLTQKCDAENEARVMALRCAEMLGHQNQKQKIKHIVDLKTKNLNLLKENQFMDAKLHTQLKTIDKLKAELARHSRTPKKASELNKENESFASPLRDRN